MVAGQKNLQRKDIVQVFIVTYNRPEYLIESIDSVLKQTHVHLEVVVSDNSTNELTFDLLKNNKTYDKIKYIRRRPSVDAVSHINMVLEEVSRPYFIVFHDDDLMGRNMVSAQVNLMEETPHAVCVGVNALHWFGDRNTQKRFLNETGKSVLKISKQELIRRYVSENQILPFCGYMYRSELVCKHRLVRDWGGKYCDAAFLISLCDIGIVLFNCEPLMTLRVHRAQDSQIHSIRDYIKLLKYMSGEAKSYKLKSLIRAARFYNIYAYACNRFKVIKNDYPLYLHWAIIKVLIYNGRIKYLMKYLVKYFKFRFRNDFN